MHKCINALIFRKGKLLFVEKTDVWILPGGKVLSKESDSDCLIREFAEELSDTRIRNIRYYSEFNGTSPHRGDPILARVYFADLDGNLGKPSEEITDVRYFSGSEEIRCSSLTQKIIDSIKKKGYF